MPNATSNEQTSFYQRLQSLKPQDIKNDAQYAKFLGIGADVLGDWRRKSLLGEPFIPTYRLLDKVATALGVTKSKIAFGDE